MTTAECLRVFKVFGAKSVDTVEKNPYLLCSEGIGINFERACDIAERLPVKPADEYRIAAGVLYVVRYNLHNGHTCLPREKLIPTAADLLGCGNDAADISIDSLVEQKQLVSYFLNGREFIFLPDIFSAEKKAADNILL